MFSCFRLFLKFLPISDVGFFPSNPIRLIRLDLGPALPSISQMPGHFPRQAHNSHQNNADLSHVHLNHIRSPTQKERDFWPVNPQCIFSSALMPHGLNVPSGLRRSHCYCYINFLLRDSPHKRLLSLCFLELSPFVQKITFVRPYIQDFVLL